VNFAINFCDKQENKTLLLASVVNKQESPTREVIGDKDIYHLVVYRGKCPAMQTYLFILLKSTNCYNNNSYFNKITFLVSIKFLAYILLQMSVNFVK